MVCNYLKMQLPGKLGFLIPPKGGENNYYYHDIMLLESSPAKLKQEHNKIQQLEQKECKINVDSCANEVVCALGS